jgi:hypothetical protein
MGKISEALESRKIIPATELSKAKVGIGRILGGFALSGAGAELHYNDPSWFGRNIMAWGLIVYGAYKASAGLADHATSVWHMGEEAENTENT